MAHPRPYPRCIFCGQRANSHEHAIPAWIGRRFRLGKEDLRLVLASDAEPRRKQPIRFGSHRERIFCKPCNRHFGRLEDEAATLIEWMARGRPIRLGGREQDILARWGAKTGYALLAAASGSFIEAVPVEHRQLLRTRGTVHPNTWIGYGSWDGYINRLVTIDLLKDRGDGSKPRSYLVIFTFAGLALQVFGVDKVPPGSSLVLNRERLPQVFPRSNHTVAWPTSAPLSDRDLRQLVRELENGLL